jgi:hypothetical protein
METKDQHVESSSNSTQQHSEADTDDVELEVKEERAPSEKMDVSHTTEVPKLKRVFLIDVLKSIGI